MQFLDFAGFLVIVVAAVASIGLNLLLMEHKKQAQRREYRHELDPSGVGSYPAGGRRALRLSSRRPLVVFFGDTRAQDWTAPLESADAQFVNRGIQRQTAAQVEGRILAHVVHLQPEAVVVQAGIHDLLTIPLFPGGEDAIVEGCRAAIARTADELIAHRCPVILTTVIPLCNEPDVRRPAWADSVSFAAHRLNAELLRMERPGLTVVDLTPLLCGEDGFVRSEFSRDLVRLGAAGYDRLNEAIVETLDLVVRQRSRAGGRRSTATEPDTAGASS